MSICLSVTNRCSTETARRRITQTTFSDMPSRLVHPSCAGVAVVIAYRKLVVWEYLMFLYLHVSMHLIQWLIELARCLVAVQYTTRLSLRSIGYTILLDDFLLIGISILRQYEIHSRNCSLAAVTWVKIIFFSLSLAAILSRLLFICLYASAYRPLSAQTTNLNPNPVDPNWITITFLNPKP